MFQLLAKAFGLNETDTEAYVLKKPSASIMEKQKQGEVNSYYLHSMGIWTKSTHPVDISILEQQKTSMQTWAVHKGHIGRKAPTRRSYIAH